jgi:NTP pyrophosphatase (non-canonical NTP hydrolase)
MACHDLRHDAATHLLDLVSEVGELSKLVLEASEYGRLQIEHDADFSGELGDVLYSLLAVAVTLEIDAGDALDGALRKYERRLAEGHGPGST